MEIPGLGEGVQAISVMLEGVKFCFSVGADIGKWSTDKIAKLVAILYHAHQKKKEDLRPGELGFSDLIKKAGSQVELMQIDRSMIETFEKYAKETQLSYSFMPDLNLLDNDIEIAFPQDQGAAFRYFIAQYPTLARPYTYGEYVSNAQPELMEQMADTVREASKQLEAQSVDMIRVDGYIRKLPENHLLYDDSVLLRIPNTEDTYILCDRKLLYMADGEVYLKYTAEEDLAVTDEYGTLIIDETTEEPKRLPITEYKNRVANEPVRSAENLKKQVNVPAETKVIKKEANGQVKTKVVKKREVKRVKAKNAPARSPTR